MKFSDNLKSLRTKSHLSQSEFAELFFISRSTVAKWENGLGLPTEENIKSICDYFHVGKEWLLGDDGEWGQQVKKIREKYRRKSLLSIIIPTSAIVILGLIILFCFMFKKSIKKITDSCLSDRQTVVTENGQKVSLTILKQPGLFTSGEVCVYDYDGDSISSFIRFKNGWLTYRYKVTGMDLTYLSDSTLYVPATVRAIEAYTLYGSVTETITVDEKNPVYDSRNDCNCIIETKTNTLIAGSLSSVIPDGIEKISHAFDFIGKYDVCMEEISIPGSVKIIEGSFRNITADSLTFEEGIEEITASFEAVWVDSFILPKSLKKLPYFFWSDMKVSSIYYSGSEEDFLEIETEEQTPVNAIQRKVYNYGRNEGVNFYFYSYVKTAESGKYWHYDDSGNPVLW